ncbi:type II toxin-antitoxin system VapC family toxin [Rhizobium sp. TH2]|uniref:type II toxin-antitoxin system VapC family toxin n=1 Tax=Rhizobium sp. TH2 TaxID=2775403 RepID=UPI0021582270|nr:type II toxin-antitoxin system VapC family toxin [Rhizobium sp. TH2]UVC10387.1 type II toxin-antitoxin system VapC family toxin [Rhizobium sp. TH2]
MILLDTSVWIDHVSKNNDHLFELFEEGKILIHPFMIGEVALGSLRDHDKIIASLLEMPRPTVASEAEVLSLIRNRFLAGSGIGYVDAQLLASTRLTPETMLWTRDKRLRRVAEAMGVAYALP